MIVSTTQMTAVAIAGKVLSVTEGAVIDSTFPTIVRDGGSGGGAGGADQGNRMVAQWARGGIACAMRDFGDNFELAEPATALFRRSGPVGASNREVNSFANIPPPTPPPSPRGRSVESDLAIVIEHVSELGIQPLLLPPPAHRLLDTQLLALLPLGLGVGEAGEARARPSASPRSSGSRPPPP